mmetsp:Transcript_5065/g.8636  ORF Transcript_5065/g.8636 Transcript_5065/m.8636 type:complete len:178 (-) Transcript_5065:264-797(-)
MGVIASFGHMIPNRVIEAFRLKNMLVVHPSLLPKYRGACPIQHCLIDGESESGVSIIEISKQKFDAGNVLWQHSVEVEDCVTTYSDLQLKLSDIAGKGLALVLDDLEGHLSAGKSQESFSDVEPSLAPMIPPEQGELSFQKSSFKDILRRHNALFGSNSRPFATISQVSCLKEDWNS